MSAIEKVEKAENIENGEVAIPQEEVETTPERVSVGFFDLVEENRFIELEDEEGNSKVVEVLAVFERVGQNKPFILFAEKGQLEKEVPEIEGAIHNTELNTFDPIESPEDKHFVEVVLQHVMRERSEEKSE